MKKISTGMICALALACGGSSSGSSSSSKDLSNWLGSWATTTTTTVTCPDHAPVTQTSSSTGTLNNGSGADLQYTDTEGCIFKFNVSGTTATLANGPVTCSTTSNGVTVSVSVTSYTLTTSDGHHLTANAAGTATAGATTCTVTLTGSGTR